MRHILLLLFLATAGLTAYAQTNADANVPAPTNAPADVVQPAPADVAPTPTAPPPPDVSLTPSTTQPLNSLNSAPAGQAAQQEEIKDIRPPFFFLRSWFWFWIILAVLAAIALIVLLWIWLKPNRQLSAKSAYELALEKLDKARALMKESDPMPYAVFVSETIRSYLGQRFQTPSTRRTTEEFLKQMEADPHTPLAEHRLLLHEFLNRCDWVKFGRYQPTQDELGVVQQHAVNFVAATKPLPPSSSQNGRAA